MPRTKEKNNLLRRELDYFQMAMDMPSVTPGGLDKVTT
jgi:hypothetical protein